jgi:hypothetical protein
VANQGEASVPARERRASQQPDVHPLARPVGATRSIDIANEFAAVRVELDETANGPRLRITDLDRGRSIELDPFEAATLVDVTVEELDALARPPGALMESPFDRAFNAPQRPQS